LQGPAAGIPEAVKSIAAIADRTFIILSMIWYVPNQRAAFVAVGLWTKFDKFSLLFSAQGSSNSVAGARACRKRTMADQGALSAPGSSTVKLT
jgi:hypothetical protein